MPNPPPLPTQITRSKSEAMKSDVPHSQAEAFLVSLQSYADLHCHRFIAGTPGCSA